MSNTLRGSIVGDPTDSFYQVLQINAGVVASLNPVADGQGHDSILSLSTTQGNLKGAIGVGNVALPNSVNELGGIFGSGNPPAFAAINVEHQFTTANTVTNSTRALLNLFGNVKRTGADTGSQFLYQIYSIMAVDSADTRSFTEWEAMLFQSIHAGSGAITNFVGLEMQLNNAGGATISVGEAFAGEIINSAGTWTAADSFIASVTNSGTMGTYYGLSCRSNTNTGTIQNVAGLYVEDMHALGVVTSWNILSKGASSKNSFEGSVLIGGNVGFYGTAVVAQQANASQAGINSVTDAAAKAALQAIYNLLKNYGLAPATA